MFCVIMQPHRKQVPPVAKLKRYTFWVICVTWRLSNMRIWSYYVCWLISLWDPVECIRWDHPIPKTHRKAGTKYRKVGHAKILTGSLYKSHFEAHEAATFKTDNESVPEAYPARRIKKSKRKRSPSNTCTEPQGVKTVKQLGNTAAENMICS